MNDKILKLREDRAKIATEQRSILDSADAAKRSLNAEETAKYDAMDNDYLSLTKTIEREERLYEREKECASAIDAIKPTFAKGNVAEEKRNAAFGKFLATGNAEYRALVADGGVNTSGNSLIAPMQFINSIIKDIDNNVFMKQICNCMTVTTSDSIGAPAMTDDIADADFTTEVLVGSADTALAFSTRELTPKYIAKLITVSNKMLNASAIPVEALVRERLAYKFGVTQEKSFMTGNGTTTGALGIFTADASGIPTSQDVSTGNTQTAVTFDGLIEAFYKIKAGYQAKASWVFSPTAIKNLRKLKDGEGQYVFQNSIVAGTPNTLIGRPLYISEYAPSTFTSGNYVGVVGDFSQYWIVTSLNMQIQRLVELYAATNSVGFIGRCEFDGAPVLSTAFARVKLA